MKEYVLDGEQIGMADMHMGIWAPSLECATMTAAETNRQIAAFVTEDASIRCPLLGKIDSRDSRIELLLTEFVAVLLPDGPAAAASLQMSGCPAAAFLDAEQHVLKRLEGKYKAGPLAHELAILLSSRCAELTSQARREDDGHLWALLAVIYAATGDSAKAGLCLGHAERATQPATGDDLAAACQALAGAYINSRDFWKAIVCLRKQLDNGEKSRENIVAQLTLAMCYLSIGQRRSAAMELDCVRLASEVDASHLQLARQLQGIAGDVQVAIA